MAKKEKKNKKEKITYVDDGSTVADMSSVGGKGEKKTTSKPRQTPTRAPLKEQWQTFFDAQKMMFFPMLAVLGIIAVAFLLVYFLL